MRCPDAVEIPFKLGSVVHLPSEVCATWPWRARCTRRAQGRSVSIHPDAQRLQELRERQQRPDGGVTLMWATGQGAVPGTAACASIGLMYAVQRSSTLCRC
jgi:hypothetical protein